MKKLKRNLKFQISLQTSEPSMLTKAKVCCAKNRSLWMLGWKLFQQGHILFQYSRNIPYSAIIRLFYVSHTTHTDLTLGGECMEREVQFFVLSTIKRDTKPNCLRIHLMSTDEFIFLTSIEEEKFFLKKETLKWSCDGTLCVVFFCCYCWIKNVYFST